MNRNTRKRNQNMSWLFALVFMISFVVAMPFMVKAVLDQNSVKAPVEDDGGQQDVPETQDPSVPEQDPAQEPETTDPGDNTEPDAENPDNTVSDTPDEGTGAGTDADTGDGGSAPDNSDDNGQVTWTTVDTSYFDDALFIGDSRTVGLSEYGDLSNADFFATTGMSVYEVYDETVSVPSVGKVTLEQLLGSMTYGKVYIMLGINELGYYFDQTVEKYGQLVDYVREMQPNAVIYIQANLHVTKSRSDTDDIFNNKNIDRFNSAISEFANGSDIFYIDVNELFDDASGNLNQEYTSDNAHVLGKYYVVWCQWIREHVAA